MSTREILNKLSIDSRRLRIGQKLVPGELPWELIQAVQADFCFLLDQGGITLEDVARSLGDGFSRGPLSRFKNMTGPQDYVGDVERIARGLNQFMETLVRRGEAPKPAGWVETEVAKRMLLVIAKTIELSSIGLIYSDAGRGKTLTLQAAAAIHPGATLIRVQQPARSASGLAKHIARLINIRGASTLQAAETRIIETLKGSGRALLIDEAHQLKHDALELVRDLHDECGIPIVLAGTVKIAEAVSDNDLFFGQFASRVALRYDVTEDLVNSGGGDPKPLHSIDEIHRLYESDKVRFADDGRILLAKIANLPGLGGLRLCTKIVQVAASAAGSALIDAKLLLQVVRTLQGRAFAVSRVEHAIEQSRVMVA